MCKHIFSSSSSFFFFLLFLLLQTCVCSNRFLVQDGIYDRFMEKLGRAMDAELRLGHGSEPDTTQGPLINARAADKVTNKQTNNKQKQTTNKQVSDPCVFVCVCPSGGPADLRRSVPRSEGGEGGQTSAGLVHGADAAR